MIRSFGILWLITAPLSAAVDAARLEFARGVLLECRGDTDSAATHFENARLADPTAAPLVTRAVSRLHETGDRPGAVRLFREFAAARPDDLSVQLSYADFLNEQGRGDALATKLAIETLEASLAKYPGHPEIIHRLVSLDRSRGDELIARLSDDAPEPVLLYATLSRSLHEADDLASKAEIDRRFLLALESHPENPTLARAASEHFRTTKRRDQAIDVLQSHTRAAPWSLGLRVRLGILEFAAGRDDAGVATLQAVLAIAPNHALAHQALAKFYRLHGNPELATHHAAEVLKIRGGSPSEFLKLAGEFLSSGKPRDARILLEKAVFRHPENPELRMKLATATHQDPETRSRAPRLFREAEAAFSDAKISDPEFLTASAEAMIEAGQSKAGEERLRAAIRAYPPDAKQETAAALRRLAALWSAENRNAEAARALLQRADSLDPQ